MHNYFLNVTVEGRTAKIDLTISRQNFAEKGGLYGDW